MPVDPPTHDVVVGEAQALAQSTFIVLLDIMPSVGTTRSIAFSTQQRWFEGFCDIYQQLIILRIRLELTSQHYKPLWFSELERFDEHDMHQKGMADGEEQVTLTLFPGIQTMSPSGDTYIAYQAQVDTMPRY